MLATGRTTESRPTAPDTTLAAFARPQPRHLLTLAGVMLVFLFAAGVGVLLLAWGWGEVPGAIEQERPVLFGAVVGLFGAGVVVVTILIGVPVLRAELAIWRLAEAALEVELQMRETALTTTGGQETIQSEWALSSQSDADLFILALWLVIQQRRGVETPHTINNVTGAQMLTIGTKHERLFEVSNNQARQMLDTLARRGVIEGRTEGQAGRLAVASLDDLAVKMKVVS